MINIVKLEGKMGAVGICSTCKTEYSVKSKYDAKRSRVGNICVTCRDRIINIGELTQAKLQLNFNYDVNTGKLTHRNDTLRNSAGDVLQGKHNAGYVACSIGGKRHLVHRVIFLFMTGRLPEQIDHIDHDKTNNRWDNLREVSNRENHLNESLSKNSTTKYTGVALHKPTGRYRAYIVVNNKQKHLGLFDNIEEAIEARAKANLKYGFHPNHGK